MSSLLEWVKAFEAPGGVVLGVLGTKIFQRSKYKQDLAVSEAQEAGINADAAKTFAEAAAILVAPLKAEIADLRRRVDKVERENGLLRTLLAQHAPHLTLSFDV